MIKIFNFLIIKESKYEKKNLLMLENNSIFTSGLKLVSPLSLPLLSMKE